MAVTLDILECGFAEQMERATLTNGELKHIRFPSLVGLIRHPSAGVMLFDTGYSNHFYAATKQFPQLCYKLLIPVTVTDDVSAAEQLKSKFNIKPSEVKFIFISHFHGDHYAGVKDFPCATFVYPGISYENLKDKGPVAATCCAFLPAMLPHDFESRSKKLDFDRDCKPLPAGFKPFTKGVDIIGDGSVIAISLPGHTVGHMGLLVNGGKNRYALLVGDAVWSSRAYRENRPPSMITVVAHNGGWGRYIETIGDLHDFHSLRPDVRIVPSHCAEVYDQCVVKKEPLWQDSVPRPITPGGGIKALVFGGTGFVGLYLVRKLLSLGVSVIASGRDTTVGARIQRDGATFIACDISKREDVIKLCSGVDVVFHTAARCEPWGRADQFITANIVGTENVVAGCVAHKVKRLVYVSTPSVYFTGKPGHRMNVSEAERTPFPEDLPSEYARTKLKAEYIVDKAYSLGLPVISIRPRGIIGTGDTTILPRLVDRLKRRRLPIIGNGDNVIDLTHVENVVESLICCMTAPPSALGKVYNITNGEPQPVWPLVDRLCNELKLSKPLFKVPYIVAALFASFVEAIFMILLYTRLYSGEPPLTRYSVNMVGLTCTLNIERARKDIGYIPVVDFNTGFDAIMKRYNEGNK